MRRLSFWPTIAIAACVAVASGCALTLDGIWLQNRPRVVRKHVASQAIVGEKTTHTLATLHFIDALAPDVPVSETHGSTLAPAVRCERAEVEALRQSAAIRTYEYRDGYGRWAYGAATLVEGAIVALATGVVIDQCRGDEADVSCWRLLYLSPLAADFVYGAVRTFTVDPPIQIDYGGEPPFTTYRRTSAPATPVPCPATTALVIKRLGTPDQQWEPERYPIEDAGMTPEALLAFRQAASQATAVAIDTGDGPPVALSQREHCQLLAAQASPAVGLSMELALVCPRY